MTIAFIAGTFVIWIAFDVWIGLKKGSQETISVVSLNFAKKYPIFPFIVGVIMGHLYWPQ